MINNIKNRFLNVKIKQLLIGVVIFIILFLCGFVTNWTSTTNKIVDIQATSLVTNIVFSAQEVETRKPCHIIFYQGEMYVPVSYIKEPSYGSFIITNETIEMFLTYE